MILKYFSLKENRPIVLYQGGMQRGRGMINILRVAENLKDYSLEEILLHSLECVLLLNRPRLLNKGAVLLVEDDSL